MNNQDFVQRLKDVTHHKTLYVMGCFGAPLTSANKTRYINHHTYNTQSSRRAKINNADQNTFGFDCVCLIKSILWGWDGDTSKSYGGAIYCSNGVPDLNADGLFSKCFDISADFSDIEPGEMLHMDGHCGVYIGDGLAIECSPKWADGVQVTAVANIRKISGYNSRTWLRHGKLPWVTYSSVEPSPSPDVRNSPDDWAKEAWEHITSLVGRDGKPVMDGTRPKDNITRQELAVVLYRLGLVE